MPDGSVTVNLAAGQENEDVDFGFTSATFIGDFIFFDANGDGKQAGDAGLAGVNVSLIQNGQVIAYKVTGADGFYKFDNLLAGEYTVNLVSDPILELQTFELDGTP